MEQVNFAHTNKGNTMKSFLSVIPGSGKGFAFYSLAWALAMAMITAPAAFAQRTVLKPGINLFSPEQDVELGREVSKDAEKQLPMLNRERVDDYLERLGKRLASYAPGEDYPYQFKCVNDSAINAFALPGGFLYINRGVIEVADNEAELAGVVGHEIGHVALRHGTNQATKSYLAQAPLALLGAFLGGNSVGAILAQIGTGFAVNSILLKYSRDDERQADLIGTQILYDANYDPIYMARFFENLETDRGGSDFFSSHPNPENRIENIHAEIAKLGPAKAGVVNNTSEFRNIKSYLKSLPPAPKPDSPQTQTSSSERDTRPPLPSSNYRSFDNGYVSLRHPDNWETYGTGDAFTLAPQGGITGSGNDSAIVYGAMMDLYTPQNSSGSRANLREATDQLMVEIKKSNPGMRVTEDQRQIRVAGQTALSQLISNDSPLGGAETDWVITLLRPEGLVYFIFVVPEDEFSNYRQAFSAILDSVRFSNR
jgi:Zn-dependent protease with chaperone function